MMTEPHGGGTYDQLLSLAKWAEKNGLASFARSDHYYSTRQPTPAATDAFATLAGLARDTTTIRLGLLVSPITFRHPAVIAKSAATIDQMSSGRFDLGLGTGWMEEEHSALGIPFPERSERFERLAEVIAYLEAAFRDDHARFEGSHFRLDAAVRPRPTGLRILIGGSGARRTPTLAGQHADEFNMLLAPVTDIAERVTVMREAAGSRRVAVSVMGQVLAGRTDAEYADRLARMARARELTSEELEARCEKVGIPFGTPTRLAESIAALAEAGVGKFYIQWLDLDDLDGFATTMEALRQG